MFWSLDYEAAAYIRSLREELAAARDAERDLFITLVERRRETMKAVAVGHIARAPRGRPMSDTCPNCGSRKNTYRSSGYYTHYLCGYATEGDKEWDSDLCELVQSRMAAARDAERDLIADWLRTCNPSKTAPHLAGCFGSADKLADAIRNNEHRKGDE